MQAGWIGPINTGAAVGADGVATINVDTVPLRGIVKAIYVKYNGDKPATADVTIKTKGTNAPSYNLLVLTDGNTDKLCFPTLIAQDTAGASRTFDGTRVIPAEIPIDDALNIAVAQTNTDDTVDVWLFLET